MKKPKKTAKKKRQDTNHGDKMQTAQERGFVRGYVGRSEGQRVKQPREDD